VKGGFLPVRSDLTFEKNENLFLKVLGRESQGEEITLQLLNNKAGFEGGQAKAKPSSGVEVERIETLTGKLSELILKLNGQGAEEGKNSGSSFIPNPLDIQKMRTLLDGLFKALPLDLQTLPKELRNQIQQVLQFSLKGMGRDIQEKITQLLNQLPEGLKDPILAQGLKDVLLVSKEGLLARDLKTAVENSGVVLEAKLKALVESNPEGVKAALADSGKVQKDLKAILLQLKAVLQQKGEEVDPSSFFQKLLGRMEKSPAEKCGPLQQFQGGVDDVLKDVETFQLLSKISDSLYTFLPIQWEGLKRGELVFKRRLQSGRTSYSCVIHLDLERLGPVSVLLFMQSRDFFVNFKTDHPELKAAIHSHLAELQENFSREGLNLKNIAFLEKSDNHSNPFDRIEFEETIISIRI
jgi:hypothetical protein